MNNNKWGYLSYVEGLFRTANVYFDQEIERCFDRDFNVRAEARAHYTDQQWFEYKIEIFYNKAQTHQALGDYVEAHSWYDKILCADPENIWALRNKAIAFLFEKKPQEAHSCFDKAKVISSGFDADYIFLIFIALYQKNYGVAVKYLDKIKSKKQTVSDKSKEDYIRALLKIAIDFLPNYSEDYFDEFRNNTLENFIEKVSSKAKKAELFMFKAIVEHEKEVFSASIQLFQKVLSVCPEYKAAERYIAQAKPAEVKFPIKDYDTKINLLRINKDAAQKTFSLIGDRREDAQFSAEHAGLRRCFDEFLKIINKGLQVLEELLCEVKKQPVQKDLQVALQEAFAEYLAQFEQDILSLRESIKVLNLPLKSYQQAMVERVFLNLQRALESNSKDGLYYETERKSLENNFDLLGVKLLELFPDRPPKAIRIFLSYSWGITSNTRRVHQLATDLKRIGFDVKLDIWHNKTGSVPVFLNYIDSTAQVEGRLVRADVVLVMCTEDLKEKLDNYATNGGSRLEQDPGYHYRGHVLAMELERIEARMTHDKGFIFPLILSGSHPSSVPGFLNPRATSAIEMSSILEYPLAFFNLIESFFHRNESVQKLVNQIYEQFNAERSQLAVFSTEELLHFLRRNEEKDQENNLLISSPSQLNVGQQAANSIAPNSAFYHNVSTDVDIEIKPRNQNILGNSGNE